MFISVFVILSFSRLIAIVTFLYADFIEIHANGLVI